MNAEKRELEENKLKEKLIKEKILERGFDLTLIDVQKLEAFFSKYSIPDSCTRDEKRYCYVFSSYLVDSIELRLGAHPMANGLLFNTNQGTRGAGYCSYINIKGPSSFIRAFEKLINDETTSCKGKGSDFI